MTHCVNGETNISVRFYNSFQKQASCIFPQTSILDILKAIHIVGI
jgi:hypothetical protein